MNDVKELLQLFCSEDDMRYALSAPFTVGEFTYATDGMIMVWVPKMEGMEGHENAPRGSLETVTGQVPAEAWDGEFFKLPKLPLWSHREPCDECDGEGESYCKHCDNRGECKACGGDGWDYPPQFFVRINDQEGFFNMRFLNKIQSIDADVKVVDNFLIFKFPEGRGMLISGNPSAENYGVMNRLVNEYLEGKNQVPEAEKELAEMYAKEPVVRLVEDRSNGANVTNNQ